MFFKLVETHPPLAEGVAHYKRMESDDPNRSYGYLLNIAKKRTEEFIQSFDSPQVQVRSSIQQAKDYQILNLKSDGCYWFDSNKLIVSVPVGMDAMDVMVRFCLTEKGSPVLSTIEDRLDRLG